MTKTLAEQLEQRLREADFWRRLGRVECFAGGRRCPTWPRFAGVCKVPYNRGRVGQVGQNTPLRHVHAGNARGRTRDRENTFGPGRRPPVSERRGFREQRNRVPAQGKCPDCGEASGVWGMTGRKRDETADWLHIRCG